jgi:hypothetical protein
MKSLRKLEECHFSQLSLINLSYFFDKMTDIAQLKISLPFTLEMTFLYLLSLLSYKFEIINNCFPTQSGMFPTLALLLAARGVWGGIIF